MGSLAATGSSLNEASAKLFSENSRDGFNYKFKKMMADTT